MSGTILKRTTRDSSTQTAAADHESDDGSSPNYSGIPSPLLIEGSPSFIYLSQCYRCQAFGHSKLTCTASFTCMKYAGKHKSTDCRKPRDVPSTCCNCRGRHVSSYRGCPAYQVRKRKVYDDMVASAETAPTQGHSDLWLEDNWSTSSDEPPQPATKANDQSISVDTSGATMEKPIPATIPSPTKCKPSSSFWTSCARSHKSHWMRRAGPSVTPRIRSLNPNVPTV